MTTNQKAEKAKYEKECIDAWLAFDEKPIIQGIPITCIPPKPAFDKIDNFGLPKQERKFGPSVPDVVEDSRGNLWFKGYENEEAERKLLLKFKEYRTNGYWFYNGDKLEYIAEDHWYQLSVCKLKVKYRDKNGVLKRGRELARFIDAHQIVFLVWREIKLNPYYSGLNLLSFRRFGKTGDAIAIKLNTNTQTREAVSGIQAQNDKYGKSIFKELVYQWQLLPRHPFFFPPHSGESNPESMLRLREPSRKSIKNQLTTLSEESLNTIIDFRACTPTAYDGEAISDLLMDEACKWENASLSEVLSVNLETIADGPESIGKIFLTTTAENIGGKTLPEYTDIWNDSDFSKRNSFGQTPSKLLRVFIGADWGYRHDPDEDGPLPEEFKRPTIDEWGYSDREYSRRIIMALRANLTGDRLIRFIRKYPLSPQEALMYTQGNCPFDTIKINDQLNHNELIRVTIAERVVRGNFDWEVGYEFKRVVWHPTPEGKWLMAWMPLEADRNQWEISNGVMRPTRNWVYTGVDPYDHKTTEDGKFSKGASASLCLGYPQSHPEKGFVCIYSNRPSDPYTFYSDMLKQAMFYSSPMIIENQKYGLCQWLSASGFSGYTMPNPLNPDQKNDGVSTKEDDLRIAMINGLIAHIHEGVGKRTEVDADGELVDIFGNCPFDDLLHDWRRFDAAKWTKSDLTVASMLSLLSLRRPEYQAVIQSLKLSDWGWGS